MNMDPLAPRLVKRGHQVAMIEVPDEDDDTAYQWWLAKGSPIVAPNPTSRDASHASRLSDSNRTNVHRRPDLPRMANPRQGDLTNGSCALCGQRKGSRGPSPGMDEAVIGRLDTSKRPRGTQQQRRPRPTCTLDAHGLIRRTHR